MNEGLILERFLQDGECGRFAGNKLVGNQPWVAGI